MHTHLYMCVHRCTYTCVHIYAVYALQHTHVEIMYIYMYIT